MFMQKTKLSQIKWKILTREGEKLCFFEYFNVSLIGEFA